VPAAGAALPPDPVRESWAAGLRVGPLFPGSVWIDDEVELDTGTGVVLAANVDAVVARRFSFGGYVLFAHIPSESGEDSATLKGLGVALRGRFGSFLQVRPGVLLGYQSTGGDFDEVMGMGVGVDVELATAVGTSDAFPLLNFGFITQPTGGNDDIDLTFGPLFYLAGGIEFGR